LQADQLLRERSCPIDVIAELTKVDPHVAAIGPAQARKCLGERREARLLLGVVFVARPEHADAPYAVALLRVCRERPRRSRVMNSRRCSGRDALSRAPRPDPEPNNKLSRR
jgi:hypothetical protein